MADTQSSSNKPLTNSQASDQQAASVLSDSDKKKTGRANDAAKLDISNLPDLLTVREVADLLRVSPLTIKRWGKRGKLPAIRINSRGDRRYKKEAVLWLLGINPDDEE
ncbi:MAG: helix-turn-helix domain-containing protein [Candidatus Woesebacteria bacterium]